MGYFDFGSDVAALGFGWERGEAVFETESDLFYVSVEKPAGSVLFAGFEDSENFGDFDDSVQELAFSVV